MYRQNTFKSGQPEPDPEPEISHPDIDLPILKGLLPLLWIGKVFGWLPFTCPKTTSQGHDRGHLRLYFTYKSLWFFLCVLTWSSFLVVSGFAVLIFFGTAIQLADPDSVEQLLDMCYHCHITVTSTLCIYQSRKLPPLLETWAKLDQRMKKYEKTYEVKALSQSRLKNILWCWLLTGAYFYLAAFGGIAYFVIGVGIKEKVTSMQEYLDKMSEIYLIKEACFWWSGYFVLFIGFLMEICWSYGDMMILLLSVSLKKEYERFNQILRQKEDSILSTTAIEELRSLHYEFVWAAKMTDKILGQITATSVICNILYLFCRIYIGLKQDLSSHNAWIVFEAAYAFVFLLGRIFVSAIAAARFNATKLKTIALLTDMSLKSEEQTYLLLVDRFLQQVTTSDVALTGAGFFVLNWGFVTTIVSALITYEVFILQFSAAASSKSAG